VPDALYLEDLTVGTRWDSGAFTVTPEEALEFARRYDPQPMHIDAEAAARGRYGELIASGWHTAALAMRTMVQARLFGSTELLGLGMEQIQWPKPVRHGDTLRLQVEVVANTPSRSKPDFGVVKIRIEARSQRDELVLSMSSNCWVPKRPAA
jgi:acyl dehydratase